MRTIVWLLLLVMGLISTPAQGESDDLPELFKALSPSVGALYAQSSEGDLKFLCTVTAIGKQGSYTILLTAFHCVRKDVAYVVTLDGKVLYAASVWKVPPEAIDPIKYRRQFGEPEVDAALFLTLGQFPSVPLGGEIKVGEQILTIGFPLGIAKIQYEGRVAGIYDRPGSENDGYVLLQIFGAPGSSGSAVIQLSSQTIVGVLVQARQGPLGLPVIFATPIRYVEKLIEVPR